MGSGNAELIIVILAFISVPHIPTVEGTLYLRGKGASFPSAVYTQWIPAFKAYRGNFDLEMTYDPVGSGSGKKAIINQDADVEYAGSDSLLTNDESLANEDLVMIPSMAGSVVVAYNIPNRKRESNTTLLLTREQLVGIYKGTITKWSDPTFNVSNPGISLPDVDIIVIARADKSGTTSVFTSALSSFDDDWNSTKGSFSEKDGWNASVIDYFGQTNRGMAGLILSLTYSIAYLSKSDATEASLEYADIQNSAGNYMAPTQASLESAMDYAAQHSNSLTGSLVNLNDPQAYPISTYTYIIVRNTSMTRCDSAKELVQYIEWFTSDSTAAKSALALGMTVVSQKVTDKIKTNVLEKMTCDGINIWQLILNDRRTEEVTSNTVTLALGIGIPSFFLVFGCLVGYIVYQKYKIYKKLNSNAWNIPIDDIIFFFDEKSISSNKSKFFQGLKSVRSLRPVADMPEYSALVDDILQWPGRWNGRQVGLRILKIKMLNHPSKEMKQAMTWMLENINHQNVVTFYGLTELEKERYVIGEFCGKGHLSDILHDERYNITEDIKFSLTWDVTNGLTYLHNERIIHGHLNSKCCFIDSRWTVKISDWEYTKLLSVFDRKESPFLYMDSTDRDQSAFMSNLRKFWVAPEIVRAEFTSFPTQASDVYSFAIVLQEIFTREYPFVEHADILHPREVLDAIVTMNLRPDPSEDTPIAVRQIMEIAWGDNPIARPSMDQIVKMLRRVNKNKKSLIDGMMSAMEDYTNHLEATVEEKTSELEVARQNSVRLLKGVLPAHIVQKVMNREPIENSKVRVGVVIFEVSENKTDQDKRSSSDISVALNDLYYQIEILMEKHNAFRLFCTGKKFCIILGLHGTNEVTTLAKTETSVGNFCLDLNEVFLQKKLIPSAVQLNLRTAATTGSTTAGVMGVVVPTFFVSGDCMLHVDSLFSVTTCTSGIQVTKKLGDILKTSGLFHIEDSAISNAFPDKCYTLVGRTEMNVEVAENASDSGVESVKSSTSPPDVQNNLVSSNVPRVNEKPTATFLPRVQITDDVETKDSFKPKDSSSSKLNKTQGILKQSTNKVFPE